MILQGKFLSQWFLQSERLAILL